MGKVIVAGHLCVDLSPELRVRPSVSAGALVEVGPLAVKAGGSVFNTGSVLAQLGVEIEAVASIGDDLVGRMLLDSVRVPGLDISRIEAVRGATTSYSIVIESAGRSRTFWHHVGAAGLFDGAAIDASASDLLHLGYPPVLATLIADGGRTLLERLRRWKAAGTTISVDMSVIDPESAAATIDWVCLIDTMLPFIDVFSPSVDDLVSAGYITADPSQAVIAEAAERMISRGARVVLISNGADGALLRTASKTRLAGGGRLLGSLSCAWADVAIWIAPEPVEAVVTTNGAGDTMTAGLLFGMLSRYSPQSAGAFAARLAATKISGGRIGRVLA